MNNKIKKLIPELRFPEFLNEDNWEEKLLGEIGEFIGGGTPDTNNKVFWNGDIPWFTPAEIKNGVVGNSLRTITNTGLINSSAKLLPVGTILLTTRATIGDVAIIPFESTTNQGFQSLIVNEEENNLFWYYWLIHHKKELLKKSSGSTFPEIGKGEIKKIKCFSPRNDEQIKIANCLSSLDKLITAQKNKLELLKNHKKGLMQNLFPQEGETVPKFRFPEFKNEGDWEEKKLGELAELTSSKRVHLSDYVSKGIPFYRGKEISQLKSNIIINDILFISENQYESIKETYGVPKIGDILITAVGTLGNVYCIKNNERFYFKDGNLIWMKNVRIDSKFLEVLLEVEKEKVLASAIGSSQKALTMAALNKLIFKIPTEVNEQQKIATCLSSLDNLISSEIDKTEKLQLHKKGLMQGLFPNPNKI